MEIGIDAVDIDRVKAIYLRHERQFLHHVFTRREVEYAFSARDGRRYERLAGQFALKEALIKAYGRGIPFREIEVQHDSAGKPVVICPRVHGKITASLTHTRRLAVACILFEPDSNFALRYHAE